jgi:hypothetical protein
MRLILQSLLDQPVLFRLVQQVFIVFILKRNYLKYFHLYFPLSNLVAHIKSHNFSIVIFSFQSFLSSRMTRLSSIYPPDGYQIEA